jgi:hypothetical protein
MTFYDPEKWLLTTQRFLKEYVIEAMDNAVLDNLGNPKGDLVYDVVMEFPGTIEETTKLPLDKTTIHFEFDDIRTEIIGFGENIFRDNFDEPTSTIRPQEARAHRMNVDVGIWTSDRAGGLTQRMRAFQVLNNLFAGSRAKKALWNASSNGDGGIEILEYSGGRFITERVGDIPMYRSVDSQLELRVYSRTPMPDPEIAIETLDQAPGLTIEP